MDTYNVFRKLTGGTKFVRPKRGKEDVAPNRNSSASIKSEDHSDKSKMDAAVDAEKGSDDTLTLLGPITASESYRKGEKRKLIGRNRDEKRQKLLRKEQVNRTRNQLHLNVVGRHAPAPFRKFEELTVEHDIVENLGECGYMDPTPIQKQAIPVMLQILKGRQVLACAPTGSGKTVAFLVPIIHHLEGPQRVGFRAVILCPTRELAKQTQSECIRLSRGLDFRIHTIGKISKALTRYGPKSSQQFDILVTTPNRLCYLLKRDPPAVSLANVRWLIVDEADKLFEPGTRSFRDQLRIILRACVCEDLKIGMFGATYTPVVAKWCCRNMRGLIRITVGQRNAATDAVDQELLFVGNEGGKLLAFRNLIRKGLRPPVLVFVQSKERAQQLFSELAYEGINVDAVHADRTQSQRNSTVQSFREGRTWILICSELMARGIDFKGVNVVVNYDFPQSAISYVHRVGRAGRAGRRGEAVTFFTVDDAPYLRSIAHVIRQSGCEVPDYMLTLKKRSKRELKRLRNSAPSREHITTVPLYELEKRAERRNRGRLNNRKSTVANARGEAKSAVEVENR